MCEVRWMTALIYFRFLIHPFGIGMFYAFVGGLALGSQWWQYVLAVVFWTIGLIYLLLWCGGRTADLNIPQPKPPQGQIRDKEMNARKPPPPPSNDGYNNNNNDGWANSGGSGGAYSQSSQQYVSPVNNNPYATSGQSSGSAYDMNNKSNSTQAGGKVNADETHNPFEKDNPFE